MSTLKGRSESTTDYSSVSPEHGNPAFEFGRLEELLGDRPVRNLVVDGVDAVFVNDPGMVRAILVKESKKYTRGDLFQKGRNFSRVGMLAENESMHRHYRRLANPFLRASKIDEYVPLMRGIAQDAVTSWRAGHALNIQAEMCRIAGAIAMGTLVPDLSPEASAALNERLAVLTWATIRKPLYGKAALDARQQGSSTELAQAREDVRKLLLSSMDDLLQSPESATGYLSVLLSDSDENGRRVMTEDQICDEVVMMLIAGTVTTASVLSWALYSLSQHPMVEERLVEDMAKAGEGGYAARGSDRSSYTYRFLSEVLRLYPPVWISCRKTLSSVTLGDRSFPEGVNVVFSSYLLHRNPDRYPEPNRFDPDRWLSVSDGAADDALYIPFGLGPKVCIGESFAWKELAVVLGTVMQAWQLSVKPGSKIGTAPETTLHPSELHMIPQAR